MQKDEVYLNLVLDFVPETVYRVIRHHSKAKQIMPVLYTKVSTHLPKLGPVLSKFGVYCAQMSPFMYI